MMAGDSRPATQIHGDEMPDAAPTGGTFCLMYRSRDLIPAEGRKAELGSLFSQARSNKAQQITGALLVSDNWFVQTLEGDEELVRALFERIAEDSRHDSVSLLDAGHVDGAVFSRWAMAKVVDEGEPDIPLIAHRDGISPAAGHKTTPEQAVVLNQMRAATQSDSHMA